MSVSLDFATLDLMDALDLAVLIEVEAYERYRMFADQLGHRADGDAADVFASMAENEAKHGSQLASRREAMFGDTPMRVSRDALFDVEAPEQGAARSDMSALKAFKVALECERKALDFYTHALPHVSDPEIVALFTELRDEEVEHVRMVQKAIAELPASARVDWQDDNDDLPAL